MLTAIQAKKASEDAIEQRAFNRLRQWGKEPKITFPYAFTLHEGCNILRLARVAYAVELTLTSTPFKGGVKGSTYEATARKTPPRIKFNVLADNLRQQRETAQNNGETSVTVTFPEDSTFNEQVLVLADYILCGFTVHSFNGHTAIIDWENPNPEAPVDVKALFFHYDGSNLPTIIGAEDDETAA